MRAGGVVTQWCRPGRTNAVDAQGADAVYYKPFNITALVATATELIG
jgi:hypothetical protein